MEFMLRAFQSRIRPKVLKKNPIRNDVGTDLSRPLYEGLDYVAGLQMKQGIKGLQVYSMIL